jgi:hypothetical protein
MYGKQKMGVRAISNTQLGIVCWKYFSSEEFFLETTTISMVHLSFEEGIVWMSFSFVSREFVRISNTLASTC